MRNGPSRLHQLTSAVNNEDKTVDIVTPTFDHISYTLSHTTLQATYFGRLLHDTARYTNIKETSYETL